MATDFDKKTMLRVKEGRFLIYRLYDVANEIDLAQAETIIAKRYLISRMRLHRLRPKAVRFADPPLTLSADVAAFELPALPFTPDQLVIRLYDFGVISVRLEIPLPPNTPMSEAEAAFREVGEIDPDLLCRQIAHQVMQEIAPALRKPQWEWEEWLDEDYLILYVRYFAQESQPDASALLEMYDFARLLMGEEFPLSQQVTQDVLKYAYTYSAEDLVIVSWETAFVYETEGIMDVPDLLEFANAQLLELVFFDEVLDEELDMAYDDIEAVLHGGGLVRYRHLRRILSRLMMTVMEITELSARVMNALKLTEDVYYAKVYEGAAEVLGLPTWMDSVQEKVDNLREIYTMLAEEASNARMMWLEVSIVVLILLEIILWLLGIG